MSKLIVEMEMPKNMCCDCDISIDGFACKKSRMNGGKCPIVGVLPEHHGDLIDADEVWKRAGRKGEADMIALAREFCNAPIVIAAERKDDD